MDITTGTGTGTWTMSEVKMVSWSTMTVPPPVKRLITWTPARSAAGSWISSEGFLRQAGGSRLARQ